MSKYCPECGNQLKNTDQFCPNCGAKFDNIPHLKNNNPKLIIIGLIILIIILITAVFFMTTMKSNTELTIKSDATLTTDDEFTLKLTSNGESLKNGKIHIVFNKNGVVKEYDAKTNSKGIAEINPDLDVGNYEVACHFEGSDKYSESSATASVTIEEAEPNYASYQYSNSFEDTDTDNDGYVYLSDMTISHTPQDIQNKMFAESDDDHDGKLNNPEYYKFMYKLNYDRSSYGLD